MRDALQMLGQERLVTIKPRSGYFITHVTLKQLRDMLGLREILEIASIERAVVRITDEQLKQLEHIHSAVVQINHQQKDNDKPNPNNYL